MKRQRACLGTRKKEVTALAVHGYRVYDRAGFLVCHRLPAKATKDMTSFCYPVSRFFVFMDLPLPCFRTVPQHLDRVTRPCTFLVRIDRLIIDHVVEILLSTTDFRRCTTLWC
jgi:hypothetical protein